MEHRFEMVAKTFKGLEEILAEELLYRANICCRTALSILKPIYKFIAKDTDSLYEMVKEYNWSDVMSIEKTFSIDTTSHSSEFTHSRFVTYRVKDAIVDYFKDRFGQDKRPGVRLNDADVMINVHIDGDRVTLSLNSSGESLHKRGWRVAQTEAPINEVLAAGIILKSGWRGDSPLVDPMCGSGTFLIEAAMIAAGIKPGSFRKDFAFEHWRDYDAELFEKVMAEDSGLREVPFKIYGSDISPKAVAIAERNILSAGVDEYINLRIKPLQLWEEAPAGGAPGVLITNPPYGERINVQDIEQLYKTLGTKFTAIGLTPSVKEAMQNGGLDCELREYVIFEGTKSDFRREGGVLKEETPDRKERRQPARKSDSEWRRDAREKGMGGKDAGAARRKPNKLEDRYRPQKGGYARSEERRRKFKEETAAQSEAEQLLSRHRNPHALKSLGESPKRPSIPAPDGPFMRTRRRWKRPDADNSSSEGEA